MFLTELCLYIWDRVIRPTPDNQINKNLITELFLPYDQTRWLKMTIWPKTKRSFMLFHWAWRPVRKLEGLVCCLDVYSLIQSQRATAVVVTECVWGKTEHARFKKRLYNVWLDQTEWSRNTRYSEIYLARVSLKDFLVRTLSFLCFFIIS